MDTIQLEVKFETLPEATEPELTIEIAVNEEVLAPNFPIDILALHNSAEKSGEHFIWTCSCGVPECGGIYYGVRVSHTKDAVIWQAPKVPLEQAVQFEFDKASYVSTIMNALREYIRYFKGYSAAGISFESAPSWQLNGVLSKMAKS